MYAAGKGPQFLHTLAEGRNLLFLQCSYCHFQAVIISAFTVTVARSSHYSTVGIHVRNYSYTNHHGKKKGELIVRALALDVGSKTSISITAYSLYSPCGNSPQTLLGPNENIPNSFIGTKNSFFTSVSQLLGNGDPLFFSAYTNSSLGTDPQLTYVCILEIRTDAGSRSSIQQYNTKLFSQCKTISVTISLWFLLVTHKKNNNKKNQQTYKEQQRISALPGTHGQEQTASLLKCT